LEVVSGRSESTFENPGMFLNQTSQAGKTDIAVREMMFMFSVFFVLKVCCR